MTAIVEPLVAPQPPPPPEPRPWTVTRIAGTALFAFWICAGVALIAYLIVAWSPTKVARYGDDYLSGLWITLSLVCLSLLLGAAISVPVALGRMSRNGAISAIAFAYVYVFRGTPLLAQLFLIYYGLGSFHEQLDQLGLWGFFREAWNCALFTFALNTSAYQAEILRGAIQSVPRGQWEGGHALGLSRFQIFRKVVMPQALIVALRPYGNEIILMIKGSAIVALIAVYDLMGETRRAFSRTYDFQAYIWAAVFYFAIVEVLRNVWNILENRLTRHLKR